METFTEVLKYTLPSTVVFLTVYFLLRQYFELEKLKYNTQYRERWNKDTLSIKLQAYERLSLLLERIRLNNLILRIPFHKDANPRIWIQSLMVAVNQEFEHNHTMQIYVSEKLWEIISFAKNETLHFLSLSLENSDIQSENFKPEMVFSSASMELLEQTLQTALAGIRKETQIIL